MSAEPMSGRSKDSSTPNAFEAPPLAQSAPPRAMWGLVCRKERWSLSWRGRLILALALLLVGALFLKSVYPCLATTHRVVADGRVVVGWVHGYVVRAAVGDF